MVEQMVLAPRSSSPPSHSRDLALSKTKELVFALQQLEIQKVDASSRAEREVEAHKRTRDQLAATQSELEQVRREYEKERGAHERAKAELQRLTQDLSQTKEELERITADFANAQGANEALCRDVARLQAQAEKSREEYSVLHTSHSQAKLALEAALQAQEAYRKEYYSTREALECARGELWLRSEELGALRADTVSLREVQSREAKLQAELGQRDQALSVTQRELDASREEAAKAKLQKEELGRQLSEAREALRERERQLAAAEKELKSFDTATRDIHEEFGKVEYVLRSVLAPGAAACAFADPRHPAPRSADRTSAPDAAGPPAAAGG